MKARSFARLRLVALFCSLCATACSAARPAPADGRTTPAASVKPSFTGAELADDFGLLRRVYEDLHPGLYRYHTKASLEASFQALLRATGNGASLSEAYRALSVFLATVKCGHTYANFFNQPKAIADRLFRSGATRVPFWFVWRDGRMVVTRDLTAGARLPRGTEVLAIDGVPSEEILRTLLTVARADGSNDRKRINALEIHGDTDLEAFDIYLPLFFAQRTAGSFALTVRPPGSGVAQVVAPALTFEQRSGPVAAALANRRGGAEAVWTFAADGDAAWLTMPTWALYQSKWDWREFLRQSFLLLEQRHTRHLVIDLRGNEGGLSVGDVLLAHLVRTPLRVESVERRVRYRKVPGEFLPVLDTWDPSFQNWGAAAEGPVDGFYRLSRYDDAGGGQTIVPAAPAFAGKVWVIVDASNSSATFEFAQAIRRERLGTLIGGVTGGNQRGINGGAFFFVRLPRTGLEADLPLIGQFPPGAPPDAGLAPDVLVETTAADIAADRDPVRVKLVSLWAQ